MRQAIVVRPRGFCAGVDRAIAIVEQALRVHGAPVYMKHAIVHNQAVVDALEAKGAVFVETVGEVPEGAVCVFSAHGSPPADYRTARERRLRLMDGVCPLVTRVHNEARKYGREGRTVLVIGHGDHIEVQGTLGHALEATPAVEWVDPDAPNWEPRSPLERVAVLTQTTLSQADVRPAVERIRRLAGEDIVVRDDICYATTNRQAAVQHLVEQEGASVVVVVGSPTSSNSRRLAETARRFGATGHLVQGADELVAILPGLGEQLGVTSGASTPERLVADVLELLRREGYAVREVTVVDEDVSFKLPKA